MNCSPSYTIAITGANGLVGSGVVSAALQNGHTVLALDRGPKGNHEESSYYHYVQVDVSNYDAYKSAVQSFQGSQGQRVNAIIHLAAVFNRHDGEGNFTTNTESHVVFNTNVAMSWNTFEIATELGIERVVQASSVNAIGMDRPHLISLELILVFSKRPRFDYLPVDENHPYYPEDAYSVSKYTCEIQADAFCRRFPSLRVASLRFHAVTPDDKCTPEHLAKNFGSWKDLWGWVSVSSTSAACLSGITSSVDRFPIGHQTFFIVADTIQPRRNTIDLLEEKFPELFERVHEFEWKGRDGGNIGLISNEKAKRILGFKEVFDNLYDGSS